jgi:hypothetical protein
VVLKSLPAWFAIVAARSTIAITIASAPTTTAATTITATAAAAAVTTTATTAAAVATTTTTTTATATAVTAATAATTTTIATFFTWTCFVDSQIATINFLPMELSNSGLRFFFRGHFNKAKTTRTTSVAIFYN